MGRQGRLMFKCGFAKLLAILAMVVGISNVLPAVCAQQLPVPRDVTDPFSRTVLLPWVGDFERPQIVSADAEEVFIPNATTGSCEPGIFRRVPAQTLREVPGRRRYCSALVTRGIFR